MLHVIEIVASDSTILLVESGLFLGLPRGAIDRTIIQLDINDAVRLQRLLAAIIATASHDPRQAELVLAE